MHKKEKARTYFIQLLMARELESLWNCIIFIVCVQLLNKNAKVKYTILYDYLVCFHLKPQIWMPASDIVIHINFLREKFKMLLWSVYNHKGPQFHIVKCFFGLRQIWSGQNTKNGIFLKTQTSSHMLVQVFI